VNRGICLRHVGKLQDAIENLGRGLKLKPELMNALWHRAFVYADQEKTRLALRDLEAYLQFDEVSEMAEEARALESRLRA